MAGAIVGFYGFQRSGKTLMAYITAEQYRLKGCQVYTNMDCPDFTTIKSLTDIPLDYKPKVLLLDEAYYFLDSRNWKNNTNASIFFNTIGKQNILLLLTSISPDMLEKRLREQHNYIYFVRSDSKFIHYKILDVQRQREKIFRLEKTQELFDSLRYDTTQVPDIVDVNLREFAKSVKGNS